ncbi:CRP-like cAMP-binding protein [Desulfitobacterium sp. LBE]|uniref:Crp/Fnr family transcriptional regulator n=1 Tax=Desulfitobacterium sp. LBE TaxID=884086 RepID=UPI00119AF4F3|nr:Crp/Fnr family transcriptional regulator [Desulfitobacterium sp. LBE]TWH57282.1 CRP-like cAMP-binding protein [Desulfitobacterium sp. LBE]
MNNQCSINHSCLFSSYCQNPGLQNTYPQKTETFKKGQIIYEEAKDQNAYIIISGIGIMNMGIMYDDTRVEEQLNLALLGKEYAFGSIVPSKSSFFVSYHVQTLTKMKVCKIPFAGLKLYLNNDKSLLEKIILANDLISNAFMRQQWIMNTNKVYDRVQRALMVLNTVQGKSWNRIPLNITHEDLAEIVNADRPSVTLGLKKLQSQGLIELGYGKIWLNNELDFFSTFDVSKHNTLSYLPLVQ